MSSPLPPLESAWQTLRSSLEWAQEFGLVFVFCSDIHAKQALFKRANDLMHAQVRPFQRPEAKQATALLKRLLPLAINPSSAHVDMGMPLWLDLDGHPNDATWDQARREFLHRLNERRATLAREHTRTVVLALPLSWTKQAAEAAPDLWTIRQPSVYLDTQSSSQPFAPEGNAPPNALAAPRSPSQKLPATVLRWQAAQNKGQTPLSAWSAARAVEAALETGHIELAWQIAEETATRIQAQINGVGKTPERLRDLSVSMNKLGDVAQTLGRLDEAQQAYSESETLDRALIDEFGKTPERLRDLSVSMDKLGNVARALGRLDEAQQAYSESKTLRGTLIDEFGKTPQRLRDLSFSMNNLGDMAQTLGRLDEAQQAYRESETLDRALIDEFGKTPERLRDLSVSMNNLGDVARALGRLDEAQQAFEAAINVAKDLIELYGETAAALHVLAYGEWQLGLTLAQLDQPDQAQPHLTHAGRLYRRLAIVRPQDLRYQAALEALGKSGSAPTGEGESP